MSVHAVVYKKPQCMKCKMTEKQLESLMPVKEEPLFEGNDEWSYKKLDKFRNQGYGSMPVVRIYDDETGERLDAWADFRADLISKWRKTLA